jgi:hypothetical protein
VITGNNCTSWFSGFFFFFFFLVILDFEPKAWWLSALPLEPHPQLFFALVCFSARASCFCSGWSQTELLLSSPPE